MSQSPRLLLEPIQAATWPQELPILRVRPALVDTSALVSDVRAVVRGDRTSLLLATAAIGAVRLLAPHQVWAEVPRSLERLIEKGDLDRRSAEDTWWNYYVPLIRFIDTAALPGRKRKREIDQRDPSDRPIFDLAELLAPTVVLAQDRDLTDLDLALPSWLPTARASHHLAQADVAMHLGTVGVVLGGHAAFAGLRSAVRLATRPAGPILAGSALILLALTPPKWTSSARTAWREHSCPALQAVGDRLRDFGARVSDAMDAWDKAVTGAPKYGLMYEVARMLACAPQPVTSRELAIALRPSLDDHDQDRLVVQIEEVMARCSAFAELTPSRWQLGRAAVDFRGMRPSRFDYQRLMPAEVRARSKALSAARRPDACPLPLTEDAP